MATKANPTTLALIYSFDAGNGKCKGISTDTKSPVEFEPVIAPLTTQRGIRAEEEKPNFSLKEGEQTLVFGIDDVFAHGRRTGMRRLNSQERYTDPDYFKLLKVLFLHAFSAYRGRSEAIAPTGVISVPVGVYNNQEVIDQIRGTLVGKHELVDYEGCTLRLDIQNKRLLIVPESYGALMHYAYESDALKKRSGSETTGTTLVVDVGYETTDISLFEGLKYQRDRAESLQRAGMGIITRAVHKYLDQSLRATDDHRIDRALQAIAGKVAGAPKEIEPVPGIFADVTDVYDEEIEVLGTRIANEVLTRFPESASRVLLAGGGAHHLSGVLRDKLAPLTVESAPDPDTANMYGAFTMLRIQSQARE